MAPVGGFFCAAPAGKRTARRAESCRDHDGPAVNSVHGQMKKPPWRGVFPAITTQMKSDGALDLGATARHADVLIESGVSGIILLGSLGENQALTPDEKRRTVAAMVKAVNGRVQVLSGVAESSTAEACRYVRDCERLSLDGFM